MKGSPGDLPGPGGPGSHPLAPPAAFPPAAPGAGTGLPPSPEAAAPETAEPAWPAAPAVPVVPPYLAEPLTPERAARTRPVSLGILISGRGSNMEAILRQIAAGCLSARAAVVLSDNPAAPGLARAREYGVVALALPPEEYPSRLDHEAAMARVLQDRGVELVCLAGYLRLLRGPMLEAFPGRILNIHPALLPAFPGLHAQRQALAHGVKVAGATVHFVDAGMDTGPIILQAAVPVLEDDDEERLAQRILAEEHRLYPLAIQLYAEGRLRLEGRRVRIL